MIQGEVVKRKHLCLTKGCLGRRDYGTEDDATHCSRCAEIFEEMNGIKLKRLRIWTPCKNCKRFHADWARKGSEEDGTSIQSITYSYRKRNIQTTRSLEHRSDALWSVCKCDRFRFVSFKGV